MSWHHKWRVLRARIDGLEKAGAYVAQTLPIAPGDSFAIVRNWVATELRSIVDELIQFKAVYGTLIPPAAQTLLDRVLQANWFTDNPLQINENLVSIAALITFRHSFEYLIQDTETEIRNKTELAFEHLRRMILVDADVRDKWEKHYYKDGETGCEKLGALHLLSHGILAFKISGQRGITDLAFNEPFEQDDAALSLAARGVVLTEWKVAKTASEVNTRAQEAIEQTKQYKSGTLGDMELVNTRYIVIVSDVYFQAPENYVEGGVTYRHIPLCLSAETASQAAKKSVAARPRSNAP